MLNFSFVLFSSPDVLSCNFSILCQLDRWVNASVPMTMLVGYVVTRWQSKYLMLRSLLANKETIRNMCNSDLEEYKTVHGQDLTNEEWNTLSVASFVVSISHLTH